MVEKNDSMWLTLKKIIIVCFGFYMALVPSMQEKKTRMQAGATVTNRLSGPRRAGPGFQVHSGPQAQSLPFSGMGADKQPSRNRAR